MLDSSRKKDLRRPEVFQWAKPPPRAPQPLPVPPVRREQPDRAVAAAVGAMDRRGRGLDAKLNTLRDYRQARRLCIFCGEKWSRDHRYPEQIQLHVLQEVWDLCHCEDTVEQGTDIEEAADGQLFLTLSAAAAATKVSSATMQFLGQIQGKSICILVDSCSSNTFVSASLASQLYGSSVCHRPIKVTVVNGNQMLCQLEFKQLQWSIQHYVFISDAKVLPLSQYDLIVGMDWLTQHSPVEIDWRYKWMLITYEGNSMYLQGQLESLPASSVLQVATVLADAPTDRSSSLTPEITALLAEFQDVFEPPVGYPPASHYDHEIPLIPGASDNEALSSINIK
jgi:hypothetical protein